MKKILLIMCLTIAQSISAQIMADYAMQTITLDVGQPVADCELTLVLDDVYYPVKPSAINGSQITLDLVAYQDYLLIINCNDYISLRADAWDVIDERDIDISADAEYYFEEGILRFKYD